MYVSKNCLLQSNYYCHFSPKLKLLKCYAAELEPELELQLKLSHSKVWLNDIGV